MSGRTRASLKGRSYGQWQPFRTISQGLKKEKKRKILSVRDTCEPACGLPRVSESPGETIQSEVHGVPCTGPNKSRKCTVSQTEPEGGSDFVDVGQVTGFGLSELFVAQRPSCGWHKASDLVGCFKSCGWTLIPFVLVSFGCCNKVSVDRVA